MKSMPGGPNMLTCQVQGGQDIHNDSGSRGLDARFRLTFDLRITSIEMLAISLDSGNIKGLDRAASSPYHHM